MELLAHRGKIRVLWDFLEEGSLVPFFREAFIYHRTGEIGYGWNEFYVCHPLFDTFTKSWFEVPSYQLTINSTSEPGGPTTYSTNVKRL